MSTTNPNSPNNFPTQKPEVAQALYSRGLKWIFSNLGTDSGAHWAGRLLLAGATDDDITRHLMALHLPPEEHLDAILGLGILSALRADAK